MARLNECDTAQWIILMGFLVSFSLFFLALVINQSTVVGQTTAESVIEFPKNDIRDIRAIIIETSTISNSADRSIVEADIKSIAKKRTHSIVNMTFNPADTQSNVIIHFNNGVTEYNENWKSL
jgi:hypothetical protein